MPSATRRRPFALVLDTLRGHATSTAVWIVAGGLTMFGMAIAVSNEMRDFPGGPEALAAGVAASAEAMRAMRWPAERLDTLGGYVTYHNVILFNFLLALYGAVQGTRAIRRGEERHALEELLATGVSRAAVVRDRAIGFAATVALISIGLGLATAAGLAHGGAPNLTGALITLGTTGLVAMVGYALGLLTSQLVGTARAAAGVSGALLTALYVTTNVWDQLGPAGVVRFASPFHYANLSRALVPGHGLDGAGTATLVGMTVGLTGLAAWAFARRDYGAPLWSRRAGARRVRGGRPAVPRVMLSSVWTAILRRGGAGLLAWAASAAVLAGLMATLQPAVMKVWASFDFIGALAGGPGIGAEAAYWSLSSTMVAPVIAAYVIAQSSGWVADLAQGRVALLLAGPSSWSRLVAGRLLALAVGVAVITGAGMGALALGAIAVGAELDAAGMGRIAVASVLFGAALGGLGAVTVAALRRGAAVIVLACVIAASYLLAYLVPMFGWPEWLNRLSVFWAFGQPYLRWPPWSALTVLLAFAILGSVAAAAISERTPKVT